MSFEFRTAGRIVFGAGRVAEIGALAAELGSRALVVHGASEGAARRARPVFAALAMPATAFTFAGEPTVDVARAGVEAAREAEADVIIGLGGGSAIDAAKAIAALCANPGEVLDYLEVVGRGQPLTMPSRPTIMVPTTAGTGAEVTRNAVLASPEHAVKASLRSPFMLPTVALVDPELTYGLPPAVTAATGLDALTQLIEPFVSCRANPLTDAFCRQGMASAAGALRTCYHYGEDAAARADMSLASLLGGLALANAGLGAVHGFAAPIGGAFDAPHGAVCAALLAPVMAANLAAARTRGPAGVVERYGEVARLLTGEPTASADDGVTWVRELVAELSVPPLRHWGVTPADHAALVANAARASSMKANALPLTDAELAAILEAV
jgi:alcohol dehydrogenase class IV